MRQGMRSARVTTVNAEPGQILWPTLARARSGQVVLLSSCERQQIHRWDMFTGRMLWGTEDAWSAHALAVASPPGGSPVVAVATENGVLRLDALTGEELDGYEMAADDTVWDVATGLLPDGRAFIAGAGHCGFRVYRWDAATGEPLGPPLVGHTTCVKAITAVTLPDGTALIASEDEAGRILRWNAASGQPYGNPIHGPGDTNMQLVSLALNDGRTMLASLDMHGALSRWDAVTGEPIGPLLQPGPETFLACAATAAGGVLFIAPYDGPIRLCDAVSGETLGDPLPGTGPAALSCSDGSVTLATRSADAEMTVRRLVDPPR
jgi:WD40 repeat protein